MNLEAHDNRDDFKVWLSSSELKQLIDAADDAEHRFAISLAGRCGLRSHEVLDVAPSHIVETDAGRMLRVWHGKGDKYRETPIPETLASSIGAVADMRSQPRDAPVIGATTTRTLRRWVRRAADSVESDDDAWRYVTPHDLRRTWATQLRSSDVDPLVVCDWGGWNDLETFLDHYRGTATPEAQLRERQKVDWL